MTSCVTASLWNPKGGEGKSTTCLNLGAAAEVVLGLKTLIVCLDIQGTSLNAGKFGNMPFSVTDTIPDKPPEGIDLILIDYPAGYRQEPRSRIVVSPIQPCRINVEAYTQARHVTQHLHCLTVVNLLDTRRKDDTAIALGLRRAGASVIRDRAAIRRAHNHGITVYDKQLNTHSRITEIRAEYEALLARILGA